VQQIEGSACAKVIIYHFPVTTNNQRRAPADLVLITTQLGGGRVLVVLELGIVLVILCRFWFNACARRLAQLYGLGTVDSRACSRLHYASTAVFQICSPS